MKQMRSDRTVLAALLLFCLYSGCVLLCLMTGAAVYRRAVDAADARFSERTALSYLAARIRAHNVRGAIATAAFGDGDALILTDPEDSAYVTYVYTHGGCLCELYTDPTLGLPPEAGEVVAASAPLALTWVAEDLLSIALGDRSICVAVSAETEVAP